MKTFLRIVGVLLAILLLAVLVAFFLPQKVAVSRSLDIAAPPEQVYPLVADLKNWDRWIPWNKEMDPTVEVVYADQTAGPGAWYTWKGDTLRTGKVEIDEVEKPGLVDFGVTFDGQGPNDGKFTFEPTDAGTKATWSAEFDMGMNPVGRYFGLALDSMVGPDFEKGLTKLKTVAEAEPVTPLPDPAAPAETETPAEDSAAPADSDTTPAEPSTDAEESTTTPEPPSAESAEPASSETPASETSEEPATPPEEAAAPGEES